MTPEEGATDRDYSLVPPVTPAEEAIMRQAFKDCDVGMDGSNCDEGAILAMRRALAAEREACAKVIEALYPDVREDYYTVEIGHVRADGAAAIRGRT